MEEQLKTTFRVKIVEGRRVENEFDCPTCLEEGIEHKVLKDIPHGVTARQENQRLDGRMRYLRIQDSGRPDSSVQDCKGKRNMSATEVEGRGVMRTAIYGVCCLALAVLPFPQDRLVNPRSETEWVDYITTDARKDGLCDVEAILFNRKRVDILTTTHAIEVDWAEKFTEGIGQSLYYSHVTHRKPGLILLVKQESDMKYVEQALVVARSNRPRIDVLAYDCKKRAFLLVGHGFEQFTEAP